MRIFGPTRNGRLNEAVGVVYLSSAVLLWLSLYSFHPGDPSFNTATPRVRAQNLIGLFGSHTSDLLYQLLGMSAWLLPLAIAGLAWKWIRSRPIEFPFVRAFGFTILVLGLSTGLALTSWVAPLWNALPPGGTAGILLAESLVAILNPTGAFLLTATCLFLSLYLLSSFSLSKLPLWVNGPMRWSRERQEWWHRWKQERELRRAARRRRKEKQAAEKELARQLRQANRKSKAAPAPRAEEPAAAPVTRGGEPVAAPPPLDFDGPPWESEAPPESGHAEIPICTLEDLERSQPDPQPAYETPEPLPEPAPARSPRPKKSAFQIPSPALLNEPVAGAGYDSFELKEIAGRIKAKLEEFGVRGSVLQINPGPVVTTFEFKPDAGVKYSRIVTLNDDLCLGLHAESIFIERLPGKPTVGIEVPNSRRELISLREILESEEFHDSASKLTICLGKDINGRIKVASLESMPHLLIAGSTGSGKSVMLNSLIMSVLFKSTPDEVRMILIDPKRVEMGIYEGIPHLLTPVITDAKQATNALRNAVLEMERRLKLLASQGVRNIDQFNRKVRQLAAAPRNLFEEEEDGREDDLTPLPYVLLVIDELADLMMLERANVEASVTRLAQMARAVGIHLVLATQRPSVDVITGLIKANFPSRISFRVATRVDSRTVLDVMGAEHLLGRGDMLYLPPGSSRLTRVHGALVTESEINRVVERWKEQALPDYDQSFLLPPPSDEDDVEVGDVDSGERDPVYIDAVRVVLEMGKASTSILQRRLRLGYGRAARILDVMQREGIIGPPDGSRPRDVLKRPDWLEE